MEAVATSETKTATSWFIFSKYAITMNEYLSHFTGSSKYKKGDKDRHYLLMSGFSTLTHVFKITLNCATIDIAIENTEKAIYYYTQFIEQMEENIMYDLNVSSNNASLFVYEKTIYQLLPTDTATALIIRNNLDYLLHMYRMIVDDLLKIEYDSFIPTKLINLSAELCRNNSDEYIFRQEIENIAAFITHFPLSKRIFYDYIYLFIKKYKQDGYKLSLAHLCLKKTHPSYASKLLNETPNAYIKWLLH
jgi:hypothetical protein